jgi:DHA1 family multidrug resistance protein-like MFS transporter
MAFWLPFVPLYLMELGATSDADALAWASVALTGLGVSRLVASPIWGVLSDRFGRKVMLVRALAFASATTIIAAVASEPWHLAIAFTSQGALSGFVPAASALTSVSAEESKLGSAFGTVNAAQYIGLTLGPVVGAILAAAFGLRGAILVAGVLPAAAALLVIVLVPRDLVAARPTADRGDPPARRGRQIREAFGQLATIPIRIGLLLSFLGFATGQVQRLAAPLIIAGMAAGTDVEGVIGLAFALAGVASVVGVVVAGRRLATPGVLVSGLVVACLLAAGSFVLLAGSGSVAAFIASFALVSLAQAALLPGTNTVIAAAVPRDQRGTVFGLVATAQALAFVVGPLTATFFAGVSFQAGFVAIGVVFLVVAGLVRRKLAEPQVDVPVGVEAGLVEAASPPT